MKKATLSIFVSAIATLCFSQVPNIQWQKTLGGTSDDNGYKVINTSDGGYLAVGQTSSYDGDCSGDGPYADSSNISKMWVVKLNASGDITWQKQLQTPGTADGPLAWPNDIAYAAVETVDGYTIAGGGGVADPHSITVLKIDHNGNQQGNVLYIGCDDGTSAYDIKNTTDGGYIVLGVMDSYSDFDSCGLIAHIPSHDPNSDGGADWIILKLDNNLSVQWQTRLGSRGDNGDDLPNSIIQTSDGGFVAVGQAGMSGFSNGTNDDVPLGNSTDSAYSDAWIVKLNSAGQVVWSKTYGGSWYDGATSVQQTFDGGYIIGAYTMSSDGDLLNAPYNGDGSGAYHSWLFKLDDMGNMQWQKLNRGINYGMTYAIQTHDSLYATANEAYDTFGTGGYGLSKFDANGNILWSKVFGGSESESIGSIAETTDGSFILDGTTWSDDGDVTVLHGGSDWWLVKIEAPATGIKDVSANPISISPNPSNGKFMITSDMGQSGTVEVFNITGEKVYSKSNLPLMNSNIDISGHAKGVYVIKISTSKEVYAQRVLVQ